MNRISWSYFIEPGITLSQIQLESKLKPLANRELAGTIPKDPKAVLGFTIGALGAKVHGTRSYCPKSNHLQIMN
jgi:hypothetical protein